MKSKKILFIMIFCVVFFIFLFANSKAFAYTCREPVITGFKDKNDGVEISWDKVYGAYKYRVFYLSNKGTWIRLAETSSTCFTHSKGIYLGKKYTYTIRCVDKKGYFTSTFKKTGWSHVWWKVPYPTTVKFEDVRDGIKISWNSVNGATRYKIFYLNSNNKWIAQAITKNNFYVDTDNIKSNYKYIYTIRCLDEKNNYISSYSENGFSYVHQPVTEKLETPRINSATIDSVGINLEWNAIPKALLYKIFYRESNSKEWHSLGLTSNTFFCDASVKSGTHRFYTVVCVDDNNKNISDYDKIGYACTYNVISRDSMIYGVDIKLASSGSKINIYNNQDLKKITSTVQNGTIVKGFSVYKKNNKAYSIQIEINGKKGWVNPTNALINAKQYIPSINVALSYASNIPYQKNSTPTDKDAYNMFSYKNLRDISGLSDTKYYSNNIAWLQYDVLYNLAGAQKTFMMNYGYSIKLYDAYRPQFVSRITNDKWNKYLINRRMYTWELDCQIAKTSKHNYAAAVDMTLINTKTGKELNMPTFIHDISTNPSWKHRPRTYSKNSAWYNAVLMYNVMRQYGFGYFYGEWWHYDMPSYMKTSYSCDV